MKLATVPTIDVQSIVPAACIQTNDMVTKALGGVIGVFTGASGSVLQMIAIPMVIVLGVAAVVTIMSNRASKFLKAMALVLLIPIAVVLGIVIYNALFNGINNAAVC